MKHKDKKRLARRLYGRSTRHFLSGEWWREKVKILKRVEYREEIAKQSSIIKNLT